MKPTEKPDSTFKRWWIRSNPFIILIPLSLQICGIHFWGESLGWIVAFAGSLSNACYREAAEAAVKEIDSIEKKERDRICLRQRVKETLADLSIAEKCLDDMTEEHAASIIAELRRDPRFYEMFVQIDAENGLNDVS